MSTVSLGVEGVSFAEFTRSRSREGDRGYQQPDRPIGRWGAASTSWKARRLPSMSPADGLLRGERREGRVGTTESTKGIDS